MSSDPHKLKEDILRKSGSEVPKDIPIEDALSTTVKTERVEHDPGDDDPSRDIGSAEVAMTFYGKLNGGSADLGPYLEKNIKRIASEMKPAHDRRADDPKDDS